MALIELGNGSAMHHPMHVLDVPDSI